MLMRECGRLQVCNSFLGFQKGVVVCSSFAGRVNGPLLLALLEATGYVDLDCVNIFKEGAAIVGGIKPSGIGASTKQVEAKPLQDLWAGHADSNARLLESLREDPNAEWLWEHTVAEAALGRMSEPERLHSCNLRGWLLQPRFAVEQLKPDGSKKYRAVDNFSWSAEENGKEDSVNGYTATAEKLKHDTLDAMAEAMVRFVELTGEQPGLYKADIEAAFRRVPVKPEHRWACGVAFMRNGQVRAFA